jgi:RimJ/RimL family protein N-acetyltransferase
MILPTALTDGVITLRRAGAEDADRLARWGRDPQLLEGVWIAGGMPSGDVEGWARTVVDGLRSRAALVIDETEPFIGVMYLEPRPPTGVELSYGVAPPFRRRGIATRAAGLASEWALREGGFSRVELRIDVGHPERCVVAERAGFTFEERVTTHVEETGEDHEDFVYVRTV